MNKTQLTIKVVSIILNSKQTRKSQAGFTLIETISVLVIMGILAAVTVPKFFDLKERSRRNAIYSAVSEIKIRINQHFGSQLLDGRTAGQLNYNSGSIDTNLGENFLVSTLNETTNHIFVNITYYPFPDDRTKNPMTRTESIEKPKIE